jgi:hypothetical protein
MRAQACFLLRPGAGAMLRITEQSLAPERRAIVLEGHLVGPWVEELRRVVGGGGFAQLRIDLSALSFADADGLALLRTLRDSGVELASPSGFIAALIGVDVDDGEDRRRG